MYKELPNANNKLIITKTILMKSDSGIFTDFYDVNIF